MEPSLAAQVGDAAMQTYTEETQPHPIHTVQNHKFGDAAEFVFLSKRLPQLHRGNDARDVKCVGVGETARRQACVLLSCLGCSQEIRNAPRRNRRAQQSRAFLQSIR